MQTLSIILATTTEKAGCQIAEGLGKITVDDIYKMTWLLVILIAVVAFLITCRQKRIARNQIEMAKMIQELIDRQKTGQ